MVDIEVKLGASQQLRLGAPHGGFRHLLGEVDQSDGAHAGSSRGDPALAGLTARESYCTAWWMRRAWLEAGSGRPAPPRAVRESLLRCRAVLGVAGVAVRDPADHPATARIGIAVGVHRIRPVGRRALRQVQLGQGLLLEDELLADRVLLHASL